MCVATDVDAEILTQSAMHRATQERDLVQVKTLVEGKGGKDQDGGVLEDKDAFGLTPLLKACLCADLAMVGITWGPLMPALALQYRDAYANSHVCCLRCRTLWRAAPT